MAMTTMPRQGLDIPNPQRQATAAAVGRVQSHGLTWQAIAAPSAATTLPERPDSSILSETIPLFFIGRNRDGFWVAREANGRVGGIFLRKQSALRFADRNTQPAACATMFPSKRFELDIENRGNPFVAYLGAAKRVVTRLALRLTAFIGKAVLQARLDDRAGHGRRPGRRSEKRGLDRAL